MIPAIAPVLPAPAPPEPMPAAAGAANQPALQFGDALAQLLGARPREGVGRPEAATGLAPVPAGPPAEPPDPPAAQPDESDPSAPRTGPPEPRPEPDPKVAEAPPTMAPMPPQVPVLPMPDQPKTAPSREDAQARPPDKLRRAAARTDRDAPCDDAPLTTGESTPPSPGAMMWPLVMPAAEAPKPAAPDRPSDAGPAGPAAAIATRPGPDHTPAPAPAASGARPAASIAPAPRPDTDPVPAPAEPEAQQAAPAAPVVAELHGVQAAGPASPRPAPAARTAPPEQPAAQLAPVLVSLGRGDNGAHHLTVRLQPAELGQVEVRVDRGAGTPVRVEITVQKQETLDLLLRDQPQLQRALDQAGLPPEGRSLTFHVAAPDPAGTAFGSGSSWSQGQAGSAGAQHDGGGQQARQHGWAPPADADTDLPTPVPTRWLRAGLDITA